MPPEIVSDDTLLDGRVALRQPAAGFRTAIDPVLLAATVEAAPGETVLDAGCGVGPAALCLAVRLTEVHVTGLDRDPGLVDIAGRNAAATGVSDRVGFVCGDVAAPPLPVAPESFDHVIANPPHLESGGGRDSPHPGKRAATVETDIALGGWLTACIRLVRHKGSVTLIHRADRLDAVLAEARGRLGGLVVFPLWPGAAKPAKRVIVRGRKGVATPLRLAPGLVLHEADGAFTAAAEAVLRHARALPL